MSLNCVNSRTSSIEDLFSEGGGGFIRVGQLGIVKGRDVITLGL